MTINPADRAFAFHTYAAQHPDILTRIPPGAYVVWAEPDMPIAAAYIEAERIAERHPGAQVVVFVPAEAGPARSHTHPAIQLAGI
ncbi:MAG: hypothetical protein HY331_13725 [Chloroflexi bacterium]|nr:hypothetical protein [Chloroflexota bacterium]